MVVVLLERGVVHEVAAAGARRRARTAVGGVVVVESAALGAHEAGRGPGGVGRRRGEGLGIHGVYEK